MTQDIFESEFQFPERVDILAPGPQGKPRWGKLGPWVLAVNKGIDIHLDIAEVYIPGTVGWIVSDWWATKTDWFYDAAGKGGAWHVDRFFSEGLISKLSDTIDVDYSFKFLDGKECVRPLGTGTYDTPIPGVLRPDGSASATAIELAARCGAKEIVLCGVDMFGDIYYDGTPTTSTECSHKGVWAFVPFANSLIKWVQAQGIEIYSLSPTALDIEVRSG